jgi:hypothetical protein
MTVTREALLALAGWADEISQPGFATATWQGGEPGPDGVILMPYATYHDRLDAFVADMYRVEMVRPVDWMQWVATPRAQELLDDPGAFAGATADEVSRILTSVIRAERFGDGSIEGAFQKGIVQAAARRARALTEA